MYKNIFFEITTKVLANEATPAEKESLKVFLADEEYHELYLWLKTEWEKEINDASQNFDYSKGLEILRTKITVSEREKLTLYRKALYKRRLLQTAAVFFLLLSGSVMLFLHSEKPSIADFAQNTTEEITSGETRLILQGKNKIEIASENSNISYTSADGTVTVNNNKQIKQELAKNEITYNTVIVPYGKRSKIVLADSSVIWLNSGSRFIYPVQFSGEKREVFLEGEALFEVAHNTHKPFSVITNNIEIKVLGTIFNVTAYPDDEFTNTVLTRGSVEIEYPGQSLLKHSTLKITPGTSAIYNPEKKTITQQQVETKYYTSWCEGILLYHHQSLADIVKKLSRYYNVKITTDNVELAKTCFSGKLDLKEDVHKVLETIAFASNLEVETKNKQITIKNKLPMMK